MKHLFTTLWSLALLVLCTSGSLVFGQDATVFFEETFDAVTPPELPAGWADADGLWATSSSVASTGSGLNNLTIAGGQAASVVTPAIDLAGLTSGTIDYLVRRTSTYPQDSLVVWASTDGGASFSFELLGMGAALPATDGSYSAISAAIPPELVGQANVVLMFSALGGTTSGSNIRIDDVSISGEGEAGSPENLIGFTTAVGSLDEATQTFDAAISLDFSNPERLQGIQFSVDWDVDAVSLMEVIRGDSIASEVDWQLNYDARTGEMRGVILGNEFNSLGDGVYDPLVTLSFSVDPSNTAGEVVLTLSEAIGALSVRTGDDAGLTIGQATHTVSLGAAGPVFEPDATALDAGAAPVDSIATVQVTVTNAGGADLVVSDVSSTNDLFSVEPASATMPAGDAQAFTVSFAPTFRVFGAQEASLVFAHNADGASDTLTVTGLGTGGLGDVSNDGLVDVLDIVLHVDFVLERSLPDAGQLASGDAFPFDAPDGALDVRDLTVLAQAVVLGAWPDELPIPAEPGIARALDTMEPTLQSRSLVRIQVREEEGDRALYLDREIALRALQVSVFTGALTTPPEFELLHGEGDVNTLSHYDDRTATLRMVVFRADGGLISAGRDLLAYWTPGEEREQARYSVAVDAGLNRLPIDFESTVVTRTEPAAKSIEGYATGLPFPNPYRASRDGYVSVPITLSESEAVKAEVYDVLGRRVDVVYDGVLSRGPHLLRWNGLDRNGRAAASGLYFIRIVAAGERAIQTVVVE